MARLTTAIMTVCLLWLFGCSSIQRYLFSREHLQVTESGNPSKPRVRLGHFDYRDLEYNPYTESNFRDMLEFHLLQRGFETASLSDQMYRTLDQARAKKMPAPAVKKDADSTRDLLPPSMKGVAGEVPPSEVPATNVRRPLHPREIQVLAHSLKFDYLIEGSLARSESGPFLEREESVVVILQVLDGRGMRRGSVSFSVKGEQLQDLEYMHRVCERLATAVAGTLGSPGGPGKAPKAASL